tara:strand:+ start:800 stop:1000 length:201 start_codon:yes stop_codon:yes gene_type:complete
MTATTRHNVTATALIILENQIDNKAIQEIDDESISTISPATLIILGLIAVAGLWSFSLLLEYLIPD